MSFPFERSEIEWPVHESHTLIKEISTFFYLSTLALIEVIAYLP
jgi:hypothetical protein